MRQNFCTALAFLLAACALPSEGEEAGHSEDALVLSSANASRLRDTQRAFRDYAARSNLTVRQEAAVGDNQSFGASGTLTGSAWSNAPFCIPILGLPSECVAITGTPATGFGLQPVTAPKDLVGGRTYLASARPGSAFAAAYPFWKVTQSTRPGVNTSTLPTAPLSAADRERTDLASLRAAADPSEQATMRVELGQKACSCTRTDLKTCSFQASFPASSLCTSVHVETPYLMTRGALRVNVNVDAACESACGVVRSQLAAAAATPCPAPSIPTCTRDGQVIPPTVSASATISPGIEVVLRIE